MCGPVKHSVFPRADRDSRMALTKVLVIWQPMWVRESSMTDPMTVGRKASGISCGGG